MYDSETSAQLSSIKVFEASVIHGLVAQDVSSSATLILAWAGRSICVFKVSTYDAAVGATTTTVLSTLNNTVLYDWILDAAFKPTATVDIFTQNSRYNEQFALVVTAHNALIQIQIDTSKALTTVNQPFENQSPLENTNVKDHYTLSVKQLKRGSRTICYSAHVKWLSEKTVLLAAGTAFGDIVLDTYLLDEVTLKKRASTTFLGHEGSIFGVRISDLIAFYSQDLTTRLLASCSDDRTIRVWDITDIAQETAVELRSLHGAEENTSGFRNHSDSNTNQRNVRQTRCIATSMGHLSRVWSINFIQGVSNEHFNSRTVTLASIGEDSTCLMWELCATTLESSSMPALCTLRQLDIPITHFGKNIWSMSSFSTSSPLHQASIVTGGADSAVHMHTIEPRSNGEKIDQRLQWFVNAYSGEVSILSPPFVEEYTKRCPSSEDLIRSYAFLLDDSFIFTTNNGRVFVAKRNQRRMLRESAISFLQVGLFADISGYSVAIGLPNQNLAFFAGTSGMVRCYNGSTDRILDICTTKSSQKVLRLFTQHIEMGAGHESFVVLGITFIKHESPQLAFLQHRENEDWTVVDGVSLDLSPLILKREITSALTIVEDYGQVQCFGLRDGTILLARFNFKSAAKSSHITRPAYSNDFAAIGNAHGKDTVTSIKWIRNRDGNGGWLYSSGRDGNIAIHHMNKDMTDITLVHQLPIPLGKDLEGLYINEHHGEFLVYGFRNVKFALYDVVRSQEVISSQCGGAHRTWDFNIHLSPESGQSTGSTLLWTKVSKANLDIVNKPMNQTIRPGLHGREVKTAAVSQGNIDDSGFRPLIATGAEDTDIRLFTYAKKESESDLEGSFRCMATIRKHNTGVQNLKWDKSANYLFSSGGFEEFFIWKINRVPVLEVGVVCESSLPVPTKSSEQRISDFIVKEIQTTDNNMVEFHITMIYSNSSIKTFRYFGDKSKRTWTLLSQTKYTTSCLTTIDHIDLERSSFVSTTGTDGCIAIWKDNGQHLRTHFEEESLVSNFTLLTCVRLHQSSIKTTSVIQACSTAMVILTGGDDNAVGITLLRRFTGQDTISTSSVLLPRAHAAAVTASTIFLQPRSKDNSDAEPTKAFFRAVTSSNDQRLKVWDVVIDLSAHGSEGINVKKAANKPTAVADVSSITVLPSLNGAVGGNSHWHKRLLVSGVGIEVWNLRVR